MTRSPGFVYPGVNLWPTDGALDVLHGPGRCELCGGRQWVAVEDPLYPEALIDARCPDCVRKAKGE